MPNSNELQRPEWMTDSFFETALRSAEQDDNITVISSIVKAATLPGDNYQSDMHRATVRYKRGSEMHEKSLIIKATIPTGIMAEVTKKSGIFHHETCLFSTVLPEMYILLGKVPSLNKQLISAKYLHSHEDEASASIVLEDLKVGGFRLADKNDGLDLKHCLLVVRCIARFHAASLILYERDPAILGQFMENVFTKDDGYGQEAFFTNIIAVVVKEVETWPDYKDRFAQKLRALGNGPMDRWKKTLHRKEGGFHVLCHGDLWANNMMFRYSEDTSEVEEVRLLDFQLTYWTSPAIDLLYFFYTSASPEVLEHSEMLVQEYYNTLCGVLKSLKCPHLQPTLSQINEELEKNSIYAVYSSVVVRTLVLVGKKNAPDMNNLVEEKESVHLSEEYKSSFKKLLDQFEANRWL